MKPLCLRLREVTEDELKLLDLATKFVAELPEPANTIMSCDEVCAAWVAAGHPGIHVSGRWGGCFSHSWIVLRRDLVLDLYPVAGVRPALSAVPAPLSPYEPGPPPYS